MKWILITIVLAITLKILKVLKFNATALITFVAAGFESADPLIS